MSVIKGTQRAGRTGSTVTSHATKGLTSVSHSQFPALGSSLQKATARGGALVVSLMDDEGNVELERVAQNFGMSKLQLAETMGIARETVHRTARAKSMRTQTRAKEMLEIVGRISEWAGGPQQAMAWYRAEPLAAFGGRTAEALIKEGKASAVRDYLDHVATGGFA